MIYIKYLILVALVVYLSIFLSKYVDALDKKTKISGAFIGGVLLAAVTSLPEFITSLTAIFMLHQPGLVQGNILGSNVFNLAGLGGCIFLFAKKYKTASLSKTHMLTSMFTLLMFITCFVGMHYQITINLGITRVNIASIIIIILYVINITKMMGDNSSTQNDTEDTLSLTVNQIILRFIICTVLLVVFSMLLTEVSNELATGLGLGATVGGAIFLGVATSLPELTASFNLIRLGNLNASFGNIIGSNLFNFTILSFADFFYRKGNIYSQDSQANNLIFWGIIATILVIPLLFAKKNAKLSMLISAMIILSYVASIVFSI